MKKFLFAATITFTLNGLLLSCGQVQKKVTESKRPASDTSVSVGDVKEKLGKLVEAAKKTGESSVNYLASDFYLKASAAQVAGDYATANLLYEYLLRLTDDDFVKTKYSVSLIRAGDLESSEKYLKEIYVNSKYKNSKIGLVLAGVYTGLNKVVEARKIYKKILSKDSKNEDACVFLSKSFALEDKFSQAKKTLERCERKDRKNGVYSYYIGKQYIDKGKISQAKKYFKRSLKKQPDFSRSVLALGLIHEEKEQFEKAVKIYKKFLKKEPSDKLILSRVVQVLFQTSKYKEIIPYAERLSDLDPEDLNLKVKLGVLYTDGKQFNKALAVFKELLRAAPKSDKILYYMAAIYQEIDELENSITYFQKIPDTSALFQDSAIQVASMLSKMAMSNDYSVDEQEKYAQRFNEFVDKKVAELPKLKVEFNIIRATYYESKKDIGRAVAALKDVRSEKKFNKDHKFYLANLLEKNKQYEEAYKIIRKMLEEDPKYAYGWNFIGYSYIERGIKIEEAYGYVQKALKLKPKDGYIMDSVAWYHYQKGEYEKALEAAAKAVKWTKNDVTITKHYAAILRKVKRFDEAKKHLVKALSFATGDTERKDIYRELKDLEQIRLPANEVTPIKK